MKTLYGLGDTRLAQYADSVLGIVSLTEDSLKLINSVVVKGTLASCFK
jgi:hypothetical protein